MMVAEVSSTCTCILMYDKAYFVSVHLLVCYVGDIVFTLIRRFHLKIPKYIRYQMKTNNAHIPSLRKSNRVLSALSTKGLRIVRSSYNEPICGI